MRRCSQCGQRCHGRGRAYQACYGRRQRRRRWWCRRRRRIHLPDDSRNTDGVVHGVSSMSHDGGVAAVDSGGGLDHRSAGGRSLSVAPKITTRRPEGAPVVDALVQTSSCFRDLGARSCLASVSACVHPGGGRSVGLVAPAGFGKTTLLAAALQERVAEGVHGTSVAWVSLDRRDGDAARFWKRCAAGSRRRQPGCAAAALSQLEGVMTSSWTSSPRSSTNSASAERT